MATMTTSATSCGSRCVGALFARIRVGRCSFFPVGTLMASHAVTHAENGLLTPRPTPPQCMQGCLSPLRLGPSLKLMSVHPRETPQSIKLHDLSTDAGEQVSSSTGNLQSFEVAAPGEITVGTCWPLWVRAIPWAISWTT